MAEKVNIKAFFMDFVLQMEQFLPGFRGFGEKLIYADPPGGASGQNIRRCNRYLHNPHSEIRLNKHEWVIWTT